jgi:predicted RNA-binding protein with PUA domain
MIKVGDKIQVVGTSHHIEQLFGKIFTVTDVESNGKVWIKPSENGVDVVTWKYRSIWLDFGEYAVAKNGDNLTPSPIETDDLNVDDRLAKHRDDLLRNVFG